MRHIGKTLATTSTASTLFQKLRMPSSIFSVFPVSQGCKCYKVGPVLLICLHTYLAGVIPAITAPSISTVESLEPKYTLLSLSLSHWHTGCSLQHHFRSPLLRCRFAHRSYGVGVISPFNLAWLLLCSWLLSCSIASLTASGSVGHHCAFVICPPKTHY